MQQRLPSLLDPPVAFAHRGARAHAPENTIEAFTLALKLGATGLESDVWLTSDGVPVLDHDGVLGPRWRRRSFGEVARSDLPDHVPTLAELLERCGTGYHLSLDLKDPGSGPATIDAVRSVAPDLLERVWLCHPSLDVLERLRPYDSTVRLVHSTRRDRLPGSPEQHAALLAERSIDAVNFQFRDWNGGLVALYHRFDRMAFAWDLQYEHVLRPVLRMGIDAVYSDHVDVMIDAVRAEIGNPEPT